MNITLTVVSILAGYVGADALLAWIWGKTGRASLQVSFFDNCPMRQRYPRLLPPHAQFLFWWVVILLWFGWGMERLLWRVGWPVWLAGLVAGLATRAFIVLGEVSNHLRNPQKDESAP